MGTVPQKLNYLLNTKHAIRSAIVTKGVDCETTDTFRSYAEKILAISFDHTRVWNKNEVLIGRGAVDISASKFNSDHIWITPDFDIKELNPGTPAPYNDIGFISGEYGEQDSTNINYQIIWDLNKEVDYSKEAGDLSLEATYNILAALREVTKINIPTLLDIVTIPEDLDTASLLYQIIDVSGILEIEDNQPTSETSTTSNGGMVGTGYGGDNIIISPPSVSELGTGGTGANINEVLGIYENKTYDIYAVYDEEGNKIIPPPPFDLLRSLVEITKVNKPTLLGTATPTGIDDLETISNITGIIDINNNQTTADISTISNGGLIGTGYGGNNIIISSPNISNTSNSGTGANISEVSGIYENVPHDIYAVYDDEGNKIFVNPVSIFGSLREITGVINPTITTTATLDDLDNIINNDGILQITNNQDLPITSKISNGGTIGTGYGGTSININEIIVGNGGSGGTGANIDFEDGIYTI